MSWSLTLPFKIPKPALRSGLALLVGAGAVWMAWSHLGNAGYARIFRRPHLRGLQQPNPPSLAMSHLSDQRPAVQWLKQQKLSSTWELNSRDRLKLRALYLPAKQPSKRLAILLHGYRGQPEDCSELAQFYYQDLDCHVLMPAHRGHGISEGEETGLGWPERVDLEDWIDQAVSRLGPDVSIVLHGLSMGGTTALMAAGESPLENVKAVISDSGYTSVEALLHYQLWEVRGFPPNLVLPQLRRKLNKKQGFELRRASAVQQLQRAQLPVLVLHGLEDRVVPKRMAYELSETRSGFNPSAHERSLHLFENADHCESMYANRAVYEQVVGEFLNRHLPVHESNSFPDPPQTP